MSTFEIDTDMTPEDDWDFDLRLDDSFECGATLCQSLAECAKTMLDDFNADAAEPATWDEMVDAYGGPPTVKVAGRAVYLRILAP